MGGFFVQSLQMTAFSTYFMEQTITHILGRDAAV